MPAGLPAEPLPVLTDQEFALFQALIRREAGIYLSEAKKALLVGRLTRRLRELNLASFSAYYRRLKEDPEERVRLIDRVSTNETHFFRERRQFEFLERQVLPGWAASRTRPRRVRAWSAGCSTGEEAYSLAAVLLARLPPDPPWSVEIVASDISTRVLEKGRAAVWPIEKAAEIPKPYLTAFFLKGYDSQEGRMKAGPALRDAVCFERRNLVEDEPPPGAFDLVFCRNVLIYFDAPTKARVLARLLAHLAPDGYLFLGHAESLNMLSQPVRSVGPTVYQRRAEGATKG
jgi:chemotaxis protein methyltransferase CheR